MDILAWLRSLGLERACVIMRDADAQGAGAKFESLDAVRIKVPPLVRLEIHRNSVDAVAEMGRRRAVIKDVSKVAAAVRAMNVGSDHAEGSVDGCLHSTLDRIIEAGPAGPAFELPF